MRGGSNRMRALTGLQSYLRWFILLLLLATVRPECINACSGHGRCAMNDMCICYRNWQANDCSERQCQFGLSFVDTPKGDLDSSGTVDSPSEVVAVNSFTYPYGTSESYPNLYDSRGGVVTQSGHAYAECSNAGICNRQTGVCECEHGFEGVACQRLVCPSYSGYWYGEHPTLGNKNMPCSGHGVCRTITSIITDAQHTPQGKTSRGDAYKLWDSQMSTACVCDAGFFGGDCHMRLCKQNVDPLYQDDFSLVSYGRYYFSILYTNKTASLSDGGSGHANFRLRVFDSEGQGWVTKPIRFPAKCTTIINALTELPHRLVDPSKTRCSMASEFNLDPLAHTKQWELSRKSRYKMYFNSVEGNHIQGARTFTTRVAPTFWAQFPRGYSYQANSSTDGRLTGKVYLIEFNGNAGDIGEPELLIYSDGNRPTIVPSTGHLFANVWTDGQRAESTDYMSNLCHGVTVRIDTTNRNYHFLTGFLNDEKIQLMRCLGDSDFDTSNNWVIPGTQGASWDYGSVYYPHIVRMVRVVTDVVDSGYYVALYYDTSVTNVDSGQGYGKTLDHGLAQGTFKLLIPFESLDHYDAVQYYIYTTKGTLQLAGNKTEAVFDFASRDFFTTNQSHIIDYGVYWRINETQTFEIKGTPVTEIQVIQTAPVTSVPTVQKVTVQSQRVYAVQDLGIVVKGVNVKQRLTSAGCSTIGSKCASFENAHFRGSVTFRFDPNYCGASLVSTSAGGSSNFCLLKMASISQTATFCPTASSCVSPPVYFGSAMTAANIKTALCSITGYTDNTGSTLGASSFMVDGSGCGVDVTDLSSMVDDSTYSLHFSVKFTGSALLGDVPPITVYNTTGAYVDGSTVITKLMGSWWTQSVVPYSGGPSSTSLFTNGSQLIRTTRGNQPDGYYDLVFTCESKTSVVTITASKGVARGDHMASNITMASSFGNFRLNQALRDIRGGTFHLIVALGPDCTYASCNTATIYPWINTKFRTFTREVELGYFYSDPTRIDPAWGYEIRGTQVTIPSFLLSSFGMSYRCLQQHSESTTAITVYDSALTFKDKLAAAMSILSPTGSVSITVTRSLITPANACTYGTDCYLGYVYTITFASSNGDVPLLKPESSGLFSPNARDSNLPAPTVVVASVQSGSMIYDGYFNLGTTYPHSYFGTPQPFSVSYIPWNIMGAELSAALSASTAFGAVSVTRTAYVPTGHVRWSGGYVWTLTFTGRKGKMPATSITSHLVTQATTATAAVGTQGTPLPANDPGVSRFGNQVGGTFGFNFTDPLGTTYSTSKFFFPVLDGGKPLTAARFQSLLGTMLGSRRITAVTVTRSATVNSVLAYKYTITFNGKDLRGNNMMLLPTATALNQTATSIAAPTIAVSETVVGVNKTVFNTQYDGEIACESSQSRFVTPKAAQHPNSQNSLGSACLSKGDIFFVLDPYEPSYNPPYLNMYRVASVRTQIAPYTPGLTTMYPNEAYTEKRRLETYKRFVIESDISSNWAQDTNGPATFRFYKFTPHEESTYKVVSECSNRGTCNHFEGVCDCFPGYSGDACTMIDGIQV